MSCIAGRSSAAQPTWRVVAEAFDSFEADNRSRASLKGAAPTEYNPRSAGSMGRSSNDSSLIHHDSPLRISHRSYCVLPRTWRRLLVCGAAGSASCRLIRQRLRVNETTTSLIRPKIQKTGPDSFSSMTAEAFSTSACSEFPCASIVTIAGKSFTRRCHIASGIPNSRRFTSSTCSTQRA